MIKTKRVYDPPATGDGHRVLVDRLWPRGLRKEEARTDEWLREIAPSANLRKWFGHDPARWPGFVERYRQELASPQAQAQLERLRKLGRRGTVTLLYAARDEQHSNATALADVLRRR
jgi:uncharacterized protein YeaO (DUF488 family)